MRLALRTYLESKTKSVAFTKSSRMLIGNLTEKLYQERAVIVTKCFVPG